MEGVLGVQNDFKIEDDGKRPYRRWTLYEVHFCLHRCNREGVWGREGRAIAPCREAGGFHDFACGCSEKHIFGGLALGFQARYGGGPGSPKRRQNCR